jgi:hypothetical protein
MQRDPKRDAQMVEDAGLTAEPVEQVNVANPDAISEHGIEAATEQSKAEPDEKPQEGRRIPIPFENGRASRQDKLDRERAAGEGMPPPPSNP